MTRYAHQPLLQISCLHCGRYEVTNLDDLLYLSCITQLQGIQCMRCNDEARGLVDGAPATVELVRFMAKELL